MKTFVHFVFGLVALASQPSPSTDMTRVKRLDKVFANWGNRVCELPVEDAEQGQTDTFL
jgi:hypothetical protein